MNFLIFATIFCVLGQQLILLKARNCIRAQTKQTVTVCEWSGLAIQCPAGQTINIISGFYGRNDHHTCPGGGREDLLHITCSLDITNQLMDSFNHGNNYQVTISNFYAGIDPCGRTFKYAIISYTCV
jgi:hypothetical protein